MKYILISDLRYCKDKLFKILILYIGIIGFYLFYRILSHSPLQIDLFYDIFGLNFKFGKVGMLETIMFFFQIFFYLYITIQLFYKDLKYNTEILFLRMKPSYWILSKILVYILFYLGILFFPYIILLLFFNNINTVLILLFKHLMFVLLLSMYGLLWVILGAKQQNIPYIGVILLTILLVISPVCVIELQSSILFLFTLVSVLLVYYFIEKNYGLVFESVEGEEK